MSAAGELVPIDAVPRGQGRIGLTKRFPAVGAVLGITAFNAPLLLVAHKLASALAAGCPCIVKPDPKTPLSALSLAKMVLGAGAPPASVSVIPTTNAVAELMLSDPRIKMLSFTGSARAGWQLKCLAATARVTLDLGGNGAVIVHEDADLDYAAARCALGGFARAGQAPPAPTRPGIRCFVSLQAAATRSNRLGKRRTAPPRRDRSRPQTSGSQVRKRLFTARKGAVSCSAIRGLDRGIERGPVSAVRRR